MIVLLQLTLQDIIENDDIRLDWLFKKSLLLDLVNVSCAELLPECVGSWLDH